MTLRHLSTRSGCGQSQLSRVERGDQLPTLNTLAKIIEALDLSRVEFFRRYELVEREAVEASRPADGKRRPSEWPQEVREPQATISTHLDHEEIAHSGVVDLGEFLFVFDFLIKK